MAEVGVGLGTMVLFKCGIVDVVSDTSEDKMALEELPHTLEGGIIGKVKAPCMPEGGVVLEVVLREEGGWLHSLSSAQRERLPSVYHHHSVHAHNKHANTK